MNTKHVSKDGGGWSNSFRDIRLQTAAQHLEQGIAVCPDINMSRLQMHRY